MTIFRLLAVLLFALAANTAAAQGNILDGPRASGAVAERYDGLAMVRDPAAGGDVQSLVDQVNAQRRQVYTQRATQQGVSADQVGRLYAAQIFAGAPAGTWFLQEDGQWIRK